MMIGVWPGSLLLQYIKHLQLSKTLQKEDTKSSPGLSPGAYPLSFASHAFRIGVISKK